MPSASDTRVFMSLHMDAFPEHARYVVFSLIDGHDLVVPICAIHPQRAGAMAVVRYRDVFKLILLWRDHARQAKPFIKSIAINGESHPRSTRRVRGAVIADADGSCGLMFPGCSPDLLEPTSIDKARGEAHYDCPACGTRGPVRRLK